MVLGRRFSEVGNVKGKPNYLRIVCSVPRQFDFSERLTNRAIRVCTLGENEEGTNKGGTNISAVRLS